MLPAGSAIEEMIGRTISHYRIQEKLGEGGMGVVYRALDAHLGRTVAVKLLRPDAIGDPERKLRFVREAKAASALNHPNIVTIHDIDTFEGMDFLAMEHVRGESLSRVIAGRRLSVEEAVNYATQIASALSAAHGAGIVHRDIKPANIIVGFDGNVKVLDFGLAKLIETPMPEVEVVSTAPTRTAAPPCSHQGVAVGTVSYMSPEQAEGKGVDARSDVFSLGTLLYEMLTGRRPFVGETPLSTLVAILRDSPAPLLAVRGDVPADLERIVLRCLEKDREVRYATAVEVREELFAFQYLNELTLMQRVVEKVRRLGEDVRGTEGGDTSCRVPRETGVRSNRREKAPAVVRCGVVAIVLGLLGPCLFEIDVRGAARLAQRYCPTFEGLWLGLDGHPAALISSFVHLVMYSLLVFLLLLPFRLRREKPADREAT